jgi:alpha-methylacyl-CoA racemase
VTGPLAGVRVIEMACIGPGPFAGMLLADMGASIVRVDRPDHVGGQRAAGADGGWLSVGAIEPKFYAGLVAGLGLAAELPPAAQHDQTRWPQARELIAATIAGRTREEWVAVFADRDACVAPVLGPGEVLSHPHLAARGVFAEVDGLVHPEPAPRFSGTPARRQTGAPLVGEHTEAVLADYGVSDADIAILRKSGAVHQALLSHRPNRAASH